MFGTHDLGQGATLRDLRVEDAAAGQAYSLGIFTEDTLVGRLNIGGITRGPFQSAGIGYWVDHEVAGRGLASSAVELILSLSQTKLQLHRLEASTLTHNRRSQRVLEKAGFQQIGMAPKYLQIAGEWQDHNLYHVILHD